MSASSSASSPLPSGQASVVAGIVAGCVTRTCTSPLDVLKILLQLEKQKQVQHGPSAIADTCRHIYNTNGLRGFWKGNFAGCCRLGPYAGVKFFVFETLVHGSPPDMVTTAHSHRAICGACAGMLATVAAYPLEVVRTRIILQSLKPSTSTGIVQDLVTLSKAEGMRGLYRGLGPGLLGSIPFEGTQFACFESAKVYMTSHRWPSWRWHEEKQSLETLDYLVVGCVAGAIAQIVAYPFDTVKKRLQAQAFGAGGQQRMYRGMVDCLVRVVRNEGVLALYRGTLPNLLRVAPHTAIMFTTYELTKHFLLSEQPTMLRKRYNELVHRYLE
ncbi:hypothetical protein H310_04708 [Aphanomyces invadans]|uniref:Mitochondrial carrier protein n=1 Tax=Aphanomyces invadans TaxID=157072 RepID=A0A024UEZ9_9STRA|nr:hypothetical protein H310_04708 [Aphanomyces invadans]ETW04432.1 hypothetical protein H310_04708 [Aphanomyces invadans]RHY31978.1 hypothetical protein DYB32_002992 [Aphanomyces invadans]|eukprot:XP_008867388.1 hypothetical protein H310_04708 [Aphanomyces invadans]